MAYAVKFDREKRPHHRSLTKMIPQMPVEADRSLLEWFHRTTRLMILDSLCFGREVMRISEEDRLGQ
jgi:hypothetical protein